MAHSKRRTAVSKKTPHYVVRTRTLTAEAKFLGTLYRTYDNLLCRLGGKAIDKRTLRVFRLKQIAMNINKERFAPRLVHDKPRFKYAEARFKNEIPIPHFLVFKRFS